MRVDRHGVSILQQMLAQEEIEATNLPKLNAGSAAQRAGHKARHHGHRHGIAGEIPEIDIVLENPLQKARARALSNRLRSRRRGSADSPEACSSASELEELLMLLEEHSNGKTYPVIRASSQKKNDSQGGQLGQSANDRYQDLRHAADAGPPSARQTHRKLDDIVRTYAARTAAGGTASYAGLEQAVLDIRTAKSDPQLAVSLTYSVLRVMREYLTLPADAGNAPGTLALVRQRLLGLVPASTPSLNQAAPALRHMHLFLPLLLLNASRPRTPLQRNLAIAKITAILRRSES
jgi:type III secretion regulatory protein HpaA